MPIKCKHNKRKSQCKDCGGSAICKHNKRKSQCKDCGGSAICKNCKFTITKKYKPYCSPCYFHLHPHEDKRKLRIENVMSEYLDALSWLKPYLMGSDKSFRTMGGCSLKRPDKYYRSANLNLWIACDENQHKYDNGDYSCEESRIMDRIGGENGEIKISEGEALVVIRWNPDKCKHSQKKINERLQSLEKLIRYVLNSPLPKENIFIYYLYYDSDNPHIVKNIPHKLLY